MSSDIASNLAQIRNGIKEAACKAQQKEQDITLLAVSKKQSCERILEACACGQEHFAENYVQELHDKIQQIHKPEIKWHYIGHLQRNKAKFLVGAVQLIHTLDRLSLAETIQKLAQEKNIIQDCLIQLKLSAETAKTGCAPEDLEALVGKLNDLQNIRIRGLMLIGTWTTDKHVNQKEFRQLKLWRDRLNEKKTYHESLTELSMGMSHDYDIAIAEGATMIRIGTDIFGERL